MQNNPVFTLFSSAWSNRLLILQLVKREIKGRYKGSILGLLWSLALPLLMLSVYTFVFTVVFQSRWGTHTENRSQFALMLFCGLIIYNLFTECVVKAPSLILSNVNYVKKVVFPLEILVWISLGVSLFFAAANFIVLLVFCLFLTHEIHWTIIFSPLIILPVIFSTVGISWVLASLGVFLRDLHHLVGVAVAVLMFLTPVFYPVDAVPEKLQLVLELNPLTFVIEQARSVVLFGQLPRWDLLAIYTLGSLIIAWIGFYWFLRTKKGFADVV